MAPSVAVSNLARFMAASIAMLAVACSSGGNDDSDAGDEDTATVEATGTTAPTQARTATATAAGGVPSFAAGKWAAGEAHVTVSGGATISLTARLLATSSTERNTTRLVFADDVKTISVSISKEFQPFAATVYDGKISVRTGNSDKPCTVTYKQADDRRVEGTFRCEDARVEIGGSGAVVIEGTFFATR